MSPIEIGTAISTLQSIGGVLKKAGHIEITAQVIELQQTLLQLFAERATHLEQMQQLRDENATLRAQLEVRDTLRFERNAYWRGSPGGKSDGPFCSSCFDVDRRLVRMLQLHREVSQCAHCKAISHHDIDGRDSGQRSVISRGFVENADQF